MITNLTPENLTNFKTFEILIPPKSELRILYTFKTHIYIKNLHGSSELFGQELTNSYYTLPSTKKSIYIYSNLGSKILLAYNKEYDDIIYYCVKDEDNFNDLLITINGFLESNRINSLENTRVGPRVLVIGGESSGKSSILRILVNYCVKNLWRPIFCELEQNLSEIDFPGIISSMVMESYFGYENQGEEQIAFFYGEEEIFKKEEIYLKTLFALIDNVDEKIKNDLENFKDLIISKSFLDKEKDVIIEKSVFSSGVFFSFPKESIKLKKNYLEKIITKINPDLIICIHDDYLKNNIINIFGDKYPLIRINKNTGVVGLTELEKIRLSKIKIQNNFFSEKFVCLREKINISDLSIYKIQSANSLPLNYISGIDSKELNISKIDPMINNLVGNILAVVNLKKNSDVINIESIIKSEILFLVHVFEIDFQNKTITIIRPNDIASDFKDFIFRTGNIKMKN